MKERKTSLIFLSSVRPFSFFYRLAVEFISNFKLFQHSCFHAYFPYLTSHFTIQADQQHMFTLGLHSFAPAITNRFPLCSNDCTYIIAQGRRNVVNKTSKTKKKPSSITFIRWQLAWGKCDSLHSLSNALWACGAWVHLGERYSYFYCSSTVMRLTVRARVAAWIASVG